MNNNHVERLVETIYDALFVVFGFSTVVFLLFFTPVGNLWVELFGVGGLYGIVPFGLYIIAILRNNRLVITLLFPLIVSIISFSAFMSLIGHDGTLIDGGTVGHGILTISYLVLDKNEYLTIFGVSLGLILLSLYSLFIFARGIYGTRKKI